MRPHAGQAAASATVQGLRRVFGDGWIAPAATDFHPFVKTMIFPTLFNRTWLAEIVAAIDTVKAVPGVHQLIERVGQKADCLGAVPELDIASRLVEAGCDIIIYPLVGGVCPDICLQTDRPLYIEVATIHAGPDPADQTLYGIIPAIMAVGGGAHVSGRFHLPIHPEHLPFVCAQIKETAFEAVRAGEVRRLREKEYDLPDTDPRPAREDAPEGGA